MATRKSIVDYISEEDYPVYTELLNKAQQIKDSTPRKTPNRGPMSPEAKKKSYESKLAKYQAQLEALLAEEE